MPGEMKISAVCAYIPTGVSFHFAISLMNFGVELIGGGEIHQLDEAKKEMKIIL